MLIGRYTTHAVVGSASGCAHGEHACVGATSSGASTPLLASPGQGPRRQVLHWQQGCGAVCAAQPYQVQLPCCTVGTLALLFVWQQHSLDARTPSTHVSLCGIIQQYLSRDSLQLLGEGGCMGLQTCAMRHAHGHLRGCQAPEAGLNGGAAGHCAAALLCVTQVTGASLLASVD